MALYGCSTHLERGTPPRHLAGYRKSLLAAHQNRGYSHFRFLVPAKICVSMDFPDCLAGLLDFIREQMFLKMKKAFCLCLLLLLLLFLTVARQQQQKTWPTGAA